MVTVMWNTTFLPNYGYIIAYVQLSIFHNNKNINNYNDDDHKNNENNNNNIIIIMIIIIMITIFSIFH